VFLLAVQRSLRFSLFLRVLAAGAVVWLSACANRPQTPGGGRPPSAQRPPTQPQQVQPRPPADPFPAGKTFVRVTSPAPYIRAEAYILIDARTGAMISARQPDQRRAVASTQKMVTAMVVVDHGDLDRRVTIAPSDAQVEPTRLGVAAGQTYTRRDLLYAFLVKSANDVAKTLARDNAGSQAAFAERMNAKMRSIGAYSSNFKNPHGLTEAGQYSTARDMARVAMAAYRNRTLRDAVSRKSYRFTFSNGRSVVLSNTNKLLGDMPECNGMKTGYTIASGRCLISTASDGGRDVILVQLGSKTEYIFRDARAMMEYGLRQLRSTGVFAGAPGVLGAELDAEPVMLALAME
jgi:D-alanyl-D-alanine carboxypeptidase (penicillin-binding protein 5/6)